MCGFVGIFNSHSESSELEIARMNGSISHRGPDSTGFYSDDLFSGGFSRLSIIDVLERANQPFRSDAYDMVLFFNGEIYNYKEIRDDLKLEGVVFETTSDTEVLYYSYMKWGNDCFNRFTGMFSVMIYLPSERRLVLARDQLGIKPIYYVKRNGGFYISSEIKAICNVVGVTPNTGRFIEFLSFGEIYGEETLYNEIYKVLPGELITIEEDGSISKDRYFSLLDTFPREKNECSVDDVSALIEESIRFHVRTDVEYGSQLSGGVDSSLVTAVMAKRRSEPFQTFSVKIDHPAVDESKYQNILYEKLNISGNEVNYSFDGFIDKELLVDSIYYNDYPLHHPNIIPSNMLNEKARDKGVKVLLSGDGADEFFSGYRWVMDCHDGMSDEDIINSCSFISPELMSEVLVSGYDGNTSLIRDMSHLSSPHEKQIFVDQGFYLQKWLHRQDRSGMRSSIEIRVPFCTVDIAKMMNSCSIESKLNGLRDSKYLLKKVADQYLDEEIVWRNKVGFPIPLDDWFRSKRSQQYIDILLDEKTLARPYLNARNVQQFVNDHVAGKRNYGRVLWALLNLEIWFRIFFENEHVSSVH